MNRNVKVKTGALNIGYVVFANVVLLRKIFAFAQFDNYPSGSHTQKGIGILFG
jgi:hypothetical protein